MTSVLRLMAMMCFFSTPLNLVIFAVYDHAGLTFLPKLVLDQFLVCWLTNPLQMSVMHVMTGQPLSTLSGRIFSSELVGIVKASWIVCVPAKAVLFYCVPSMHRILYIACIAFGWQMFLSFSYNSPALS